MGFVLTFIVVGFVAGLLARALVSGPGPKGILRTTLLGIVGSFLGGFLGYVLFHRDLAEGALQPSGWSARSSAASWSCSSTAARRAVEASARRR